MHAQFLDQFALAGDAIEIADQENAQQKLRINRRSARLAVTLPQLLAHEGEADVLFDESQQVGFPEPDLPAGSSRTTLQSGRVVPS